MGNKKNSKLENWRKKYAGLSVALACLSSAVVSWGDNWFMSALLLVGVVICGTIGIFDLKRTLKKDI